MGSTFKGTDQPPTRSALLTANWRGWHATGPPSQPMAAKLLARPEQNGDEEVHWQSDQVVAIGEPLPQHHRCLVEVLIEVLDRILASQDKFRLAPLVEESAQVGCAEVLR